MAAVGTGTRLDLKWTECSDVRARKTSWFDPVLIRFRNAEQFAEAMLMKQKETAIAIRRLRVGLGLSLRETAAHTGIHIVRLGEIERAKVEPTLAERHKLLAFFLKKQSEAQ